MISYLTLIQALKASPDGITFKNAPTEVLQKVINLASIDCIELSFPEEKTTVAKVKPPVMVTNVPVIERVQVSFWNTGARAGLFSQQAYPIVDRPKDGYVTVELMANRRYTVDVARTKAVA